MADRIDTDICVIGAGSGGLSFAAGAVQLGKKVVLVEHDKMGGDCLNYGCVPSKALLAAGRAAQNMRDCARYGIAATDPVIDYAAVHGHIHGVIDGIAPNDSQERFEGLGCTVLRSTARFVGPREMEVGEQTVRAKHFVIATGSAPFVPPIEGLDRTGYLTNETLFDLTEAPDHLLIVGGGPIGVEMAQAHRRLGCRVTLFEQGDTIMPKDDPDLVGILRDRLIEEGITINEGMEVVRTEGTNGGSLTVTVRGKNGTETVKGSHILLAVGRRAKIDPLNLIAAGVETENGHIKIDERLRTSNSRVWAIGDCTGDRQFTHVAGYHASVAVRNILFKVPTKNGSAKAPWVTYTDPELSHVGWTKEEAARADEKTETVCWDYEENDRARAERETTGRIIVRVGKGGAIRGVSIVGAHAGELIGPWQLAIEKGLKIKDFTDTIMPYPTLSEISKRAAGDYYRETLFSDRTRLLIRLLSIFD